MGKIISLIEIITVFFRKSHSMYIFNVLLLSGNEPNESANGVAKTIWNNHEGDTSGP